MSSQDAWDLYADAYQAYFDDDSQRLSTVTVFPKVLEFAGDLRDRQVLDFGCGQGRFSRRFCDLGAKVIGFDRSEAELEIARKQDRKGDILYTSDASLLGDRQFDFVLCFMVLLCNSKPDSLAIARRIYQWTKVGGTACFVNTNTKTLGEKFKDFYSEPPDDAVEGTPYKTIIPTSKGAIEAIDRYYSPTHLRNLFAEVGFQVCAEEIVARQFVLHVLKKV